MSRAKTLRFPGFTVDISKVERVDLRVDGNYTISLQEGSLLLSSKLGKTVQAAWNRHHWESITSMDAKLEEYEKYFDEIREDLCSDGPYLKGKFIYSWSMDGIHIEEAAL